MSTQPQVLELPRRLGPDLIERVANALPPEIRADYYREMSHCRSLPENDEMLRILRAMQFLVLLIERAPAAVALEREKLEQVLGGSLETLQSTQRDSQEYQRQMAARLADLPGEIARGIDPWIIARRITDSLQERFTDSGIPETAKSLDVVAKQMIQATADFQKSARQLMDSEAKVADTARQIFGQMQTGMEQSSKTATQAAQRLGKAFLTQYRWSVVALCSIALVLGFMAGFMSKDWLGSPAQAPATSAVTAAAPVASSPSAAKPSARRRALQAAGADVK